MQTALQLLREKTRFVFLDRDGVINRKLPEGEYVTSPDALILIPGAASAIARLNKAGLKVLIITNQRGISLGLYTAEDLEAIHEHLAFLLSWEGGHVDGIYHCPHARNSCECRKPLPGLFLQAFRDHPGATPANSLMIGDSLSDIEAGYALGMSTVYIEGDPKTQARGAVEARQLSDFQAESLASFVDAFIA